MKMLLLPTLAVTALCGAQASGQSAPAGPVSGFSYNYVEIGYARVDVDGFSDEADEIGLGVSVEVNDLLYAFGGYATSSLDTSLGDLDVDTFHIGLGARWPLAAATDGYVQAAWLRADADLGGASSDADGWQADLGLRHLLLDRHSWEMDLELEARVSVVDFEDSSSETGFGVGVRLYLSEQLSLGLGLQHFEDSDAIGASFRAQW